MTSIGFRSGETINLDLPTNISLQQLTADRYENAAGSRVQLALVAQKPVILASTELPEGEVRMLRVEQRLDKIQAHVVALVEQLEDLRGCVENPEVLEIREVSDTDIREEILTYVRANSGADAADVHFDLAIDFDQAKRVCDSLVQEGLIEWDDE